jgi:hypothetical protein
MMLGSRDRRLLTGFVRASAGHRCSPAASRVGSVAAQLLLRALRLRSAHLSSMMLRSVMAPRGKAEAVAQAKARGRAKERQWWLMLRLRWILNAMRVLPRSAPCRTVSLLASRQASAERTLQELVEKRTKADKRASALQLELDEAKLVAAALYDKEQVALAETELCRKDVYGTADNAAAPSASDARSAPLSPAQILEAIMALPGSDDTAEAKFLRALSSPRPAQGSAGASGAASGAAVGSQKRGVTIASFAKQLAEADEDCDIDQIEELEKIVAGKRAKLGTK